MIAQLKEQANKTRTLNGAAAFKSTLDHCLDLFYMAGTSRHLSENEIGNAVIRAYSEDHALALRIIFFARDVRGGLGERRFFRIALKRLALYDSRTVNALIPLLAEYGRFDDLCALLNTCCESAAANYISGQLKADMESLKKHGSVSLLAKWLPSANASSQETKAAGKKLAKLLGMSEKEYRHTLTQLRAACDVVENRLREKDYTFDYEKLPSNALFKYRAAFIRCDYQRYSSYLEEVQSGSKKIHARTLYPYEIVRSLYHRYPDCSERMSLDTLWNNLPVYGENTRALAVIDGSYSMTWNGSGGARPIDVALSLGLYFAEHNETVFGGHFITFSQHPRLVEVMGRDIAEKVSYCASFNECANTDLEAVFELLLSTAVKNRLTQEDMPEVLYIISDMQFDYCIEGGNDETLFRCMKRRYAQFGLKLPNIVFWNVSGIAQNCPVTVSDTGCALISGFTPALFDLAASGDIDPRSMMLNAVMTERYEPVAKACA